MYIRRTTKKRQGHEYYNYLLVESISTPKGPRQRVICSLGDLSARSESEWLQLVGRVEDALRGQDQLLRWPDDPAAAALVRRVKQRPLAPPLLPLAVPATTSQPPPFPAEPAVSILPSQTRTDVVREAGPLHVANCFWHRLGLSDILAGCGMRPAAVRLAQAMVASRLIAPSSEHAMDDWFAQVASEDLLGLTPKDWQLDRLYRELDLLHPHRATIECALAKREEALFQLDRAILLYDLSSSYFEGQALANPKAQRGYSRDQRPDCKQVVLGLALRPEGFPVGHELFAGNQQDGPSLPLMIAALKNRFGLRAGETVVVDRGMASAPCLKALRDEQLHYIVATRQSERQAFQEEFEDLSGFTEIIRQPSPTNPCQRKSGVRVRAVQRDGETWVLCLSEGREAKDRAIREKAQARLLNDLQRLQRTAAKGHQSLAELHQSVGRLRERYPRVARYFEMSVTGKDHDCQLSYQLHEAKLALAVELDGAYLMRSDRLDLTADEIWRTYTLLTRVEQAFRDLKTPLQLRPIHHQLERRVESHIFLSLLAYHLLIAIETTLRAKNDHRSWTTLREQLRRHHTISVILKTSNGGELTIRQGTDPEPVVREIYELLGLPARLMIAKQSYRPPETDSDEKVTG